MRNLTLALVIAIGSAPALFAQEQSTNPAYIPARVDVSAGYAFIRANAPPAGCKCFGTAGGYASVGLHLTRGIGVTGEFTASHANRISGLGQNLTLKTFAVGPHISLSHHRTTLFGEALFGIGHGSDSYFPQNGSYTTSANSFMYSAGGGVDVSLNRLISLRLVEGQFLHTSFPNGTDGEQRQLSINSGLIVKLGGHHSVQAATSHVEAPAPPPPPPPPPAPHRSLALWCNTNLVTVTPGQILEVLGNTMTEPDGIGVNYSWTTTGGAVNGGGREISIDTTGMQPGRYRITGHAVSFDDPNLTSSCDLAFLVKETPSPLVIQIPPAPLPDPVKIDRDFHEAVKDAYFDYDKWDLRPDTQLAIAHAAAYMKAHPDVNVMIGGYSDERGGTEYNLTLGVKRADATRKALIAAGIDPTRLQIISYGKGTQLCTVGNEACWQQNRRAAFLLHP